MRPRSHKHLLSLLSLPLFASLALPLFLCLMKEAGWSPAGLNDGVMDVRFKLGNHSFYVVASITAATNITSHTSRSPDTLKKVILIVVFALVKGEEAKRSCHAFSVILRGHISSFRRYYDIL